MLKVTLIEVAMLIVLDIGRDIILRSLIQSSHDFSQDLSKLEIFFSIRSYLVSTIFIIVFDYNLWRILSTIKNLWLMNCSSIF